MSKGLGYVKDIIENEGFEYAFIHYSDFEDVEVEEFHKLRIKYCDAREDLYNYIEKHCGTIDE